MKTLLFTLCLLFTSIYGFSQESKLGKLLTKQLPALRDNDETVVIIYFTDKGNTKQFRTTLANSVISQRSINRRMKVRGTNNIIDEQDYSLDRSYVQAISNHVMKVRHELKWFNAMSVVATKPQIEKIRLLPFVKEIELVGRWKKRIGDEEEQNIKYPETSSALSGTTSLDYGTSFTQVNQIRVPKVHDLGIYGQGVVVGVFDNGFRLLTHEAFSSMNIIAQHDFVDHKESVIPNNTDFGSHGVNTLSTIGGYKPGELVGPAFKADYILARTENDSSETPIEEDYWAAAIQWADSIGVDVTSTSLSYLTYDSPYTSWTWADMDGNTTLITKAADRAVELGIIVVVSAGNAGAGDGIHNTLGGPADGDSVITAGAVYSDGARTSFSSVGPSADGRTKPDIMAMGSSVKVASSSNPTGYGLANGTSFSCPLSAGVAALILSSNPTLTPIQVREAMRQTASNAATPNNLMGWGILNTDSAIKYYGALPLGRISGNVFHDLNGNGVKDAGEPIISGRNIYLTSSITDSTITDVEGNYFFDSLAIGTYTITEDIPNGWRESVPISMYSVNLLHGIDTSGYNFGNFQLGAVHGTKFNDVNANGVQNIGESGLPDWGFTLTGPSSYRAVTDSNGNFSFTDLEPGIYTLSESAKVGWAQTFPLNNNSYSITIRSGLDTTGLIFGNYLTSGSSYSVLQGWSLFSLPVKVSDYRKSILYPTAISDAFIYDHSYQTIDTLSNGIGFWLKFDAPQSIVFDGTPRLIDTIDIKAGWNMIGTLSDTVVINSIIQIPDSIISSGYFCFCFGGYVPPDYSKLLPHHGYWVKAKLSGKLVLNALASRNVTSAGEIYHEAHIPSNSITIEDNSGKMETLYFEFGGSRNKLEKFEIPPKPPDGIFDVRYESGRVLEIAESGTKDFPILISSASYPVTIQWKMDDGSQNASLIIDGKEIRLSSAGKTQILDLQSQIRLRLSPGSFIELPKEFSLKQNYPNPFNPSTIINYQLPTESYVTLKIYNIFGQEVRTLVDGMQNAGYKLVEFSSNNLASGVYYYKLTAGNFVDVKKMILIH